MKMKRSKSEIFGRRRYFKVWHVLLGISALYLLVVCFKFPGFFVTDTADGENSDDEVISKFDVEAGNPLAGSDFKDSVRRTLENEDDVITQVVPQVEASKDEKDGLRPTKPLQLRYGRLTSKILRRMNRTCDMSVLERMADEAWALGLKAWEEVEKYNESDIMLSSALEGKQESCPSWVSVGTEELTKRGNVLFLPCGLAAGSSITLVGTPHFAHNEYISQLAKLRADALVRVSQFTVELQGLKAVSGEDPPKILHLNPRLRGDWSHRPVIEHNTCYRMQWGTAQRCDGIPSENDDEILVDGFPRCGKWMRSDVVDSKDSKDSKESRTTSWFKRFVGRAQKPEVTWPFPFVEGKLFVLTIRAGVDGFHIIVGGQHVTSFPYRMGFTLEDATGLAIKGGVDVHSVYATSLPISHPSFSPQKLLEMSVKWKSDPLPLHRIRLFIGVISATNHFAERMAVRKTWMQSSAIKAADVVVRFFVALNPRKDVNAILKQEAAYFGDIIILPFMDRYELVVLKTIAICDYGVQNVTAEYIMKCDDDTFVRMDAVLKELDGVSTERSLYMGNLNLLHRPLRTGKWAVTFEEWPEAVYPPYANGPGYIISNDIAKYIMSEHVKRSLRLFKMEDVSVGMWVEQFNTSTVVKYVHNWKFCQYGCMDNYITAHYQSPRQMICLWDNLARGQAHCCNF